MQIENWRCNTNVEAIPAVFIVDPKSGAVTREVRERVLSPEEMLAWLK
jgi:hypothetical protein